MGQPALYHPAFKRLITQWGEKNHMSLKTYSTICSENEFCRLSEEEELTVGFQEAFLGKADIDLDSGRWVTHTQIITGGEAWLELVARTQTQESVRRAEWTEQKFMEGVAGDKTETQMGQSRRTPGSQAQSPSFTSGTLTVFSLLIQDLTYFLGSFHVEKLTSVYLNNIYNYSSNSS